MKDELTYCKILGTNINVTNMDDTIAYLTDNLEELKGDYICVSNVHTTVMAYRDKAYRRVQNSRCPLSAGDEAFLRRGECRDRT